MTTLINQGRAMGMPDEELAITLASVNVESGFNPEAAAGSSSATGLGQIIDGTRIGRPAGSGFGPTKANMWEIPAQASSYLTLTSQSYQSALDLLGSSTNILDIGAYTYGVNYAGLDRNGLPNEKYFPTGINIGENRVAPLIPIYMQFIQTYFPANNGGAGYVAPGN